MALATTHGRLLGGLLAGDREAAATRQTVQYPVLVADVAQMAAGLLASVDDAVKGLEREVDTSAALKQLTAWRHNGMPKDAIAALTKNGLGADGIKSLEAAVGDPETVKRFGDFVDSIRTIAANLGAATLSLRDQAPRVLNLAALLDGKKSLALADLNVIGRPTH